MSKRGGGRNLYRRNGVWWARVQVAGKDVRRSLRTSDRAQANERLKRLLDDAARIRAGDAERHTYQEAVVAWVQTRFGGIGSERTASRYRTSLRMLDRHFGGLFVDQITRRLVGDFVRARGKQDVSNATIRRDLTALSRLLALTVALGWRDDNPAREWDRSTIRERRDPITRPCPRSIELTAAVAPGNFGPLIRFLLATGLRLEEGASLQRSSIDWKTSQLTMIRKGRRRHVITISQEAVEILRSVPAAIDSTFVFWGRNQRMRGLSTRFGPLWRRAARRAKAEGWEYRHFRLHDLRHEYAIRFLEAGGSIYDLQLHLGHTSVRTTEMYCQFLTPDEARRAKRLAQNPDQ